VAVVPDQANDLLNLGVFYARQDRGVGLFEEAARAVQPRGAIFVGKQGVDEGAGVLIVNNYDD
jgi:hypothetical protein